MKTTALSAISLVLVLALTTVVTAQSGNETSGGTVDNPYLLTCTETDIKIDGVLDEQAWQKALRLELNYEIRPGENIVPLVKTEVFVTYNKSYFYAAFRCYDPDPASIRARYRDHDGCTADDMVSVILDTFNDERRGYLLMMNPRGAQYDAIKTESGEDSSWDAIWDCAGRIHDWGWSAEMEIPFSSLRFQHSESAQVWGFDLRRVHPRNYRRIFGTTPLEKGNNCFYCQLPKFSGFEGVSPGRNIEINPTITAVRTDERRGLPDGDFEKLDQNADFGLTTKWGITPNMTFSASLNPDFSQIEADSLQLDINQPFALYYQEKRPFFTEGTDFFNSRLKVIHTRTMRDPNWGLKLTGKTGTNTIGAYVVRDNLTNIIFPGSQHSDSVSLPMESTASVFRYKRDISNKYTLGAIVTDREGGDYFNRVYGFDGDFRVTDADFIQAQILVSSTRYPEETARGFAQEPDSFSGSAMAFRYLHSTRNLQTNIRYTGISENFRADLGYMPQVNYDLFSGYVIPRWYGKPGSWWSEISIGLELDYFAERNGTPLDRNFSYWIDIDAAMQTYIELSGFVKNELYNGTEFKRNGNTVSFRFRPSGSLSIGTSVFLGDGIDYANTRPAEVFSISPEITYNIGAHLRLDFSHNYERLDVESGRLYAANISQLTAVYQLNRRSFFRSILQYVNYDYTSSLYLVPRDPAFSRLFTQALFSYKINPFTVLFLGYSDNYYGNQNYGLTQANRTFFVKLGYAWTL